jgi:hypothetical protein
MVEDKYKLNDESLNLLDKIRVEAIKNILEKGGDRFTPFQQKVLTINKKDTQKKIDRRNRNTERKEKMANKPFADLLKDFKLED